METPPPLKISLAAPKFISYDDMQKELEDHDIFKYDKIISDDRERSVCIYLLDGIKYVMKLGNRSTRNNTNKFHLLKKEIGIYKEISNFPEDAIYFPKMIASGIVNSGDIKNEFHYIIIEYIEGKTLYDYLNEKNSITDFNNSNEILTILLNLTMALNALWSHGIVHGDLSVENVMIKPDLNVKLIDFEKSAKYIPLKLNTIGTSKLNVNSKDKEGYGFFFLVRISLSVLKNRDAFIPFLRAIKTLIQPCDDCKDIYYKCAELINAEIIKKTGGSKTRKLRKIIRNKRKVATRNSMIRMNRL